MNDSPSLEERGPTHEHGILNLFGWMKDFLQTPMMKPPEPEHEFYVRETEDGEEIALWRYPPTNQRPGEPVFLVHGLSLNHRIFTLPMEISLVSYLRERGYDCWAVDLRGRTLDEQPDKIWGFDHYAQFDIPASLECIVNQSTYNKVHWIGMSMGGMLYYAVAGTLKFQKFISSGTCLGSPVKFHSPRLLDYFGSLLHGLPFTLKRFHAMQLIPLVWYTFELLPRSIHTPLINTSNISEEALRQFCAYCIESGNLRTITQFPEWFVRDEWTHREGKLDYRDGLKEIRVPTQIVAGDADPLCPNADRAGLHLLEMDEKKFIKAGADDHFPNHFSHVDLLYGEGAFDYIYPEIAGWLQKHSM